MQRNRNLAPLTGALFVVLTLIAFFAIGGNTPEGDDSAQKVVSFYSDHETKEIIAAVVLALGAVALIFFAATMKQRLEAASPDRGILPTVALGAGIVASGGFLTAATLHFALADYAGDIDASAAQALNAIDSDFFLPFVMGLRDPDSRHLAVAGEEQVAAADLARLGRDHHLRRQLHPGRVHRLWAGRDLDHRRQHPALPARRVATVGSSAPAARPG